MGLLLTGFLSTEYDTLGGSNHYMHLWTVGLHVSNNPRRTGTEFMVCDLQGEFQALNTQVLTLREHPFQTYLRHNFSR